MNEQDLQIRVAEWDSYPDQEGNTTSRYQTLLNRLSWFGDREWSQYQPAMNPKCSPRYMARLAQWIGSIDGEDNQKLLLEYAMQVSFFSHDDFLALYQSAFSGPIVQWVIKQCGFRLDQPDFSSAISEELRRRTWFCPITDSMDINEFYHVNHITSIRHRPAFSTLAMLDPLKRGTHGKRSLVAKRMLCYMANPARWLQSPSLKRLILLEDFVGSGTQARSALLWALNTLQCPILFVPLMICPLGSERLAEIVAEYPNRLEVRPVMAIGDDDLLGPRRPSDKGWERALESLKLKI